MNPLNLIPEQYRVAAGAIGALVIVIALAYAVYRIDQNGYNRCDNAHKAAVGQAQTNGLTEAAKVEGRYENQINSLQAEKDSGVIVGPLTSRAIDGLR